jgi:hypothetical protein
MRKRIMDRSAVRMADVAAAAGVSRSTVSNALSRPELVQDGTRKRIEQAIIELGYVPNPDVIVRKDTKWRGGNAGHRSDQVEDPVAGSPECPCQRQDTEFPTLLGSGWHDLDVGDTVELSRQGMSEGLATVDAIGADRTVLWVWLAHGRGRIMIHVSDGVHVMLVVAEKSSGPDIGQ